MTAPYTIQPLPIPDVRPGQFIPAPTGADQFYKAAGDLAAVLHAVQAASQQSQIQNRGLDVQRELGLGNIGVQQAETRRLLDKQAYDQEQARQAQLRAAQTGRGLRAKLQAHGIQGLDSIPDESLVSLMPDLERAGIIAPLTTNERDFRALRGLDPTLTPGNPKTAQKFERLIMPQSPVTNIDLGSRESTKLFVDLAGESLKKIDAGLRLLPNIAEAYRALGNDKVITGAGANYRLALRKGLAFFGDTASGDIASDTEKYLRLTQSVTMGFLAGRDLGSGTAVSDQDRAYMQGLSGENLTKQPAALKSILRINYGAKIMELQDEVADLRQAAIDVPGAAAAFTRRAEQKAKQLEGHWNSYLNMLIDEEGRSERIQEIVQQLQAQYPEASWVKQLPQRLEQRVRQQDAKDAQDVRRSLRGR